LTEERTRKQRRLCSPALVLLFLAPVLGELLSGSAPPAEFFQPFGFILLTILYGGGAILARELTHRWDKGWPTLLALGAAYGIAEEGLMCKSFFDPAWMDLGELANYGRWFGVNWVWSVHLTIFHAVFSIAIPVLLVSLIFPARRSEAWISRRTFKRLSLLWVANGAFIFLALTPYRPPLMPFLSAALIAVGCVRLARRLPRPACDSEQVRLRRPLWFGLTGFLGTVGLFVLAWVSPVIGVPPLLAMLLMAGWPVVVAWIVLKVLGRGVLCSERHQLALASGGLILFVLLAPIQEFDQARVDDMTGMTLVGVGIVVLLAWLAWRVRWRDRVDSQMAPGHRKEDAKE